MAIFGQPPGEEDLGEGLMQPREKFQVKHDKRFQTCRSLAGADSSAWLPPHPWQAVDWLQRVRNRLNLRITAVTAGVKHQNGFTGVVAPLLPLNPAED